MYRFDGAKVVSESESGKALLIYIPEIGENVWIPKRGIHDDSEIWKVGQEPGELVIEDWVAEQKGWI